MSIPTLIKFSMAMLIMMIFIIPQSFYGLKLPFLGLVLVWIFVNGFRKYWKIRSKTFVPYYFILCLMSMIWVVIGLANGNPDIAIIESLRVYVVYMVVYFALTIYVSNIEYQSHIDKIVTAGGLGIGIVAIVTLLDHVFQMNLIPQFIRDEMFLQVGLHDGYSQMNNVNIGMLTFIVPYLLSRLMLSERKDRHALHTLGLVVSVAAVLVASRRVVMVLILITPLLIYAIHFLTDQPTSRHYRRWNRAYFFFILSIGTATVVVNNLGINFFDGFIDRFKSAFDTDPNFPRPLQHAALLSGFYDNLFWGSGFGGVTDVVRSGERPWTFELTYSRLLFNGGLIGFGLIFLFYFVYTILVLRKIRKSFYAPIYISLLTGFLTVAIASASNPYLSSFDFLFVLSIIPLILNSEDHPNSNHKHEWGHN